MRDLVITPCSLVYPFPLGYLGVCRAFYKVAESRPKTQGRFGTLVAERNPAPQASAVVSLKSARSWGRAHSVLTGGAA